MLNNTSGTVFIMVAVALSSGSVCCLRKMCPPHDIGNDNMARPVRS
jgi:hypothetical protein